MKQFGTWLQKLGRPTNSIGLHHATSNEELDQFFVMNKLNNHSSCKDNLVVVVSIRKNLWIRFVINRLVVS